MASNQDVMTGGYNRQSYLGSLRASKQANRKTRGDYIDAMDTLAGNLADALSGEHLSSPVVVGDVLLCASSMAAGLVARMRALGIEPAPEDLLNLVAFAADRLISDGAS